MDYEIPLTYRRTKVASVVSITGVGVTPWYAYQAMLPNGMVFFEHPDPVVVWQVVRDYPWHAYCKREGQSDASWYRELADNGG